jgi:RimJ/RimL family protein N-acetyltransferase
MRLHIPQSSEENELIAAWAAAELKVTFAPPYIALASVDHRGTIIGVAVLNNFDCSNIDVTGIGEGAFTPSVIRSLAHYIFIQLNCSRVTLRTRRSNHRARRMLAKHFKPEATLKSWFGTEDAFQFRMCRDECPWLRKEHGIIPIAAAAA